MNSEVKKMQEMTLQTPRSEKEKWEEVFQAPEQWFPLWLMERIALEHKAMLEYMEDLMPEEVDIFCQELWPVESSSSQKLCRP